MAERFATQSPAGRNRMVSQLDALLPQIAVKDDRPFRSLLNYWRDVTEQRSAEVDGRHIAMAYLGDASPLSIGGVPDAPPPAWKAIKEPLWNGLPVPPSAKVKNYPLFRGENRLIDFKMAKNGQLFHEDSLVWKRLNDLFSQGKSAAHKTHISALHSDVFIHSLDSFGSAFIGSTTFFQNARDFGRKSGTNWSAIIEFRGDGVDVNEVSRYFEKIPLLNASKARFPLEMEVAINYGIDPRSIRAVWFIHKSAKMYYVLNPNFVFE